ncbi:MAG: type I-F CRISPR-associated endoribonuclease Cas6/Csy4 [Proteobacteria bacterium]|nr:type I-F CRISPR-associated endoribonuclease Cas6/Csy4 [Pseudomonadota bacterium]
MQPTCYFNIEVRGAHVEGFGGACVWALQRTIGALHPIFKAGVDQYAMDLPAMSASSDGGLRKLGHLVRVFCSDTAAANDLADQLEANAALRDLVMIGRIKAFDANGYSGPWITLRRFRVAPRTQPDNRKRDLEVGVALPYVKTRSATNSNAFTLMFRRFRVESPTAEGRPNSYGLSGPSPIHLPDLGM